MGTIFLVFVIFDVFGNNKSVSSLKPFMLFALMILGIGTCFKVLHWKYSNELLISSVSLIIIIYLVQLALLKDKGFEEYAKTFFIIMLGVSTLFTVLHWRGKEILTIVSLLFFILYFGLLIVKYFRRQKEDSIPPPGSENNL
jgi:hypothetical protein